ncbi:hypothetical protein R0381_000254 [Jeongeupia wiesaeckerbachi]|uniref:hypothetical protein n=1 Tax=Jeongeupia wiesaeckerbachi TaxID=3051218 RepID=UPI003D8091FE
MKFRDTFYIKISKNTITIRCIETQEQATATSEFSSNRLLVGNFTNADKTIKELVSRVTARRFYKIPVAVIHPLEMVDGGLSQIEERIFKELALSSGARKAYIHLGPLLNDSSVLATTKT